MKVQSLMLGSDSQVKAKTVHVGKNCQIGNNTHIAANDLTLGDNVQIGDDVHIMTYDKLAIGSNSRIASKAQFKAWTIEIGDWFYSDQNPTPLIFGGGGADRPTAKIKIGSRCVMHDSFINCFMPVTIGDDVGFSAGSVIVTHGFWNNVLEGFNSKFQPVTIRNHVIIGVRAMILPGVMLGDYCSVGAGAVVTKSFPEGSVVAGVPARLLKTMLPHNLTLYEQAEIVSDLLREYSEVLKLKADNVSFTGTSEVSIIKGEYDSRKFQIIFTPCIAQPFNRHVRTILVSLVDLPVSTKHFMINLSNQTWKGTDDEVSDDLRDFLRHYGLRIFSSPFKSLKPSPKELGPK